MKNNINNWCFKKYREFITVLNESYPKYYYSLLIENGFKINDEKDARTVVDWKKIDKKFSFFYNYEGCEEGVSTHLRKSAIVAEEFLIIEFGYNLPIIKLETNVFIENWYDFVKANGFMGITIISKSGSFVMEFTDDADFLLNSNFPVKT